MENLNEQVASALIGIDEEYSHISSLQDQVERLFQESAGRIKETVEELMPLMEKMRENRHFFRGIDTKYISKKGPVLKHDIEENDLYVYDLEKRNFCTINLYDDEVKVISYRRVLEKVDFTVIMESLLLVLDHHNIVQREMQAMIDKMETKLSVY